MSDTAIVRNEHKPRILFLCTGNSCRSQMAEGWLRALHGNRFAALSAGIVAHGMNPLAQQVMAEASVAMNEARLRKTYTYVAFADISATLPRP